MLCESCSKGSVINIDNMRCFVVCDYVGYCLCDLIVGKCMQEANCWCQEYLIASHGDVLCSEFLEGKLERVSLERVEKNSQDKNVRVNRL